MLKPTMAFKDKVSNYPKEPSLRIGRCVPKNAVNLAYYYNPTATDAEKVLATEAPRNTVDHRVEEAYRYLFDQVSDDDDLFPKFVEYEDEEGYVGRLGRMYVNWYPEAHIELKNVQCTKEILVKDKDDVPTMIEYKDADGYTGQMYLDATEFEITNTTTELFPDIRERQVLNHELNYHIIMDNKGYIAPNDLAAWYEAPTAGKNTKWPYEIKVDFDYCVASGGDSRIVDYVNKTEAPYGKAMGSLKFDNIEYEPVYCSSATSGYVVGPIVITETFSNKKDWKPTAEMTVDYMKGNVFKPQYNASYSPDSFSYGEINSFLSMANKYCSNLSASFFSKIREAMNNQCDISIVMTQGALKKETSGGVEYAWFEVKYKYTFSTRPKEGTYQYNVVANYSGTLKETWLWPREIPTEYKVTCHYTGVARKVWYDYDGVAYYRGAVTKGNSVGNVNPGDDNELLMYSDEEGYLRQHKATLEEDEDGNIVQIEHDFYRVEADYIYLTDVFKDGVACFYKHNLKQPIYDYRGPDERGFYEGDAVKIFTSNLKNIPSSYKHNMKLKVAETEIVNIIDGNNMIAKEVPKRYSAELYTSFVSSSTDTFKVVYNAFDDNDKDNVAIKNGVTEEIYNYPFMLEGRDFFLDKVDTKARLNKIRLPEPCFIPDTRRYITFDYTITAERKSDGKKFTTSPVTSSILNKDYSLACESSKFIERAMIVSPRVNGQLYSPYDLVMHDQAALNQDPIITKDNASEFTFYATIVRVEGDLVLEQDSNTLDWIEVEQIAKPGMVNIKCNPDGSGYITAETTEETGFFDESNGRYTKCLSVDNPYLVERGRIYPAFKVKCIDSRFIKVQAPREDGLLDSWYPAIKFGHYSQILDQYGVHKKVCYTMPEYDSQHFSSVHGYPFVDIQKEKVRILNSHMIKTKCFPLMVYDKPDVIKIYKEVDGELFDIKIKDISFSDGIIITKDTISENDNIICDYTYVEENYIYRGYWRNKNDFARIDLNPNMYHTYSDLNYTPSQTKPSKNLFNKVVYFFLRPTVIYQVSSDNDSLIYEPEYDEDIGEILLENTESTLYHQIDNPDPESEFDIYIGSVYIRQNTSLESTILIDSRTRGGGVISSMKDSLRQQLEPESDYYLDIGFYDGEPYQENGVIIVRLDNRLLKEFGGRFTQGDIEAKVKRWLGFGVYPIIEYVNSYTLQDLPQYSLTVEDEYVNIIDLTPEIFLECVIE